MRFDAPRRPGWRDLRAELRRGLAEGRLPVLGVPGAVGGRFSSWETSDDLLVTVAVEYGEPDASWMSVETARWAGTIRSTPDLRETLRHHLRGAGVRFADVAWGESRATLVVDGRELTARVLHAGEDWWAAWAAFDGGAFGELEVVVVGYRKAFEPRLAGLPDAVVAEMLDAPLMPQRWPQAELSREPVDPGGEPHRRLVHMVLLSAREQLVWLDEGGPAPRRPASWPAVWRSAIQRQAELSGQSEEAAEEAVQSLLTQLTSLQSGASWFREDDRLRERAISETLLFATGLSVEVPSRAAQEAWREREGTRQAAPRPMAEAVMRAGEHWLALWSEWAQRAR
ncbi:hypothetical protein [Actinoplanes sp. L3-i22]|uniref:hypothetical protein n=1 Tax=Actinoplanes sp. L3-i22 TaxID=2836373 RepID=UPI001C78A709|nr:hypothetical protein [Actinoplanes sp. L3-i22]BCY13605.1 hypothetical protein L3i22_086930 [Actinoplanes sp. L3-i22]